MSLEGLIIREAREGDYGSLITLEQKVIDAERPYNASLKKEDAYYYDIEKLLSDCDSRLVVGEVSGAIIATGYVQVRHSKPAPSHCRRGIGCISIRVCSSARTFPGMVRSVTGA